MINKSKKQTKILIPNATSPKNIGDQAMLQVLVNLVKGFYKNALVTVHSADPDLYKSPGFEVKHTLYSWSVFRERQAVIRIMNLVKLAFEYIALKSGFDNLQTDKELRLLIEDYKNSDLIIFTGGGYLRSKKGIKQSLNLVMQLSLFLFAGLFPTKKIVAPISVGPFGYKWQEKITVKVLKQMDLVALREELSYKTLQKYKMKNIVLSTDHALLVKKIKKETPQNFTLGFTIREWLKGNESKDFEQFFIDSVVRFSNATGAKIQPIVQVDASKYGEDDFIITKKIAEKLKQRNINVLKTKKITGVKNALKVYSNINLLLGMRMHSNILAAVQGVPFVAISYEYKTEGIARSLGMEKYCIKCEKVNGNNLHKLLTDAYKNRNQLKSKIDRSIKNNLQSETQKWNFYLSK